MRALLLLPLLLASCAGGERPDPAVSVSGAAARGVVLQLQQKRLGLARARVEVQKAMNALDDLEKK